MKRIIIAYSLLTCFMSFEIFAQYGTPFNSCYQTLFSQCTPGCGTEAEVSKAIPYNGCEIIVTYKIRHCECPTPTTFIQINYIRINISEPEACCDLVCYLFPPGPFTKNCNPNQHNLNCYNNPPNSARLFDLTQNLYDQLSDSIFNDVRLQYTCPQKLTIKYFWPSECFGLCLYDLSRSVPGGEEKAFVIVPNVCQTGFCCGKTLTYCKDLLGVIQKTVTTTTGNVYCGDEYTPQCKLIGESFNLDGTIYTITNVRTTECYSPCAE